MLAGEAVPWNNVERAQWCTGPISRATTNSNGRGRTVPSDILRSNQDRTTDKKASFSSSRSDGKSADR